MSASARQLALPPLRRELTSLGQGLLILNIRVLQLGLQLVDSFDLAMSL